MSRRKMLLGIIAVAAVGAVLVHLSRTDDKAIGGEEEVGTNRAQFGPPVTPAYDPIPDQAWLQVCRLASGPPVAAAVIVRLADDGRLSMQGADGWHATTLNKIRLALRTAKLEHHRRRLAEGHSGFDTDDMGTPRASRIFVEIDAQPLERWEHLLWLFVTCSRESIDKVQLRCGERMMHVFLPWDAAIEWTDGGPLMRESRLVLRSGSEHARYFAGQTELEGLDALERHWAQQQAATHAADSDHTFVPVLMAEKNASVGMAFGALQAILAAGIPRVSFDPVIEPDPEAPADIDVKQCQWIPYPADCDREVLPSRS